MLMFDAITVFFFFVLGTIIGSFLNVLVFRHGTGIGIQGRSRCLSCAHTLQWFELVPIFSWIALRGRCRMCGSRISPQYPAVELLSGFLFAILGASPALLSVKILGCAIVALFVAIAVYDIRHTIIPDTWVAVLSILALIYATVFSVHISLIDGLWIILSGPLIASPLYLLWMVSRGAWMGFGDVKLAIPIGWIVGLYPGVIALFGAFMIGALVGVCILLPIQKWQKIFAKVGITRFQDAAGGFTMSSEVPFGPFLIVSFFIVWFSILYELPLMPLLLRSLLLY